MNSKHANSVGVRLVRELTWALRNGRELAREMKSVEEGEFISGRGNSLFSKGMMTAKIPWHLYTPYGCEWKRKSDVLLSDEVLWQGPQSSLLVILGLGVLLDLKGMERWGLSRSGSRVISRHTYISTPILISNSIIHPEIENLPYSCYPTGWT